MAERGQGPASCTSRLGVAQMFALTTVEPTNLFLTRDDVGAGKQPAAGGRHPLPELWRLRPVPSRPVHTAARLVVDGVENRGAHPALHPRRSAGPPRSGPAAPS